MGLLRARGLDVAELSNLSWVTVRTPTMIASLPSMEDLGPGETEVLALALESTDALVLWMTGLPAFFQKCKGFSSAFFMALYTRFIGEVERKAPKQYCREVAHLQKR